MVLDSVPESWDAESWGSFVWDAYTAAVSNTQAAAACPSLVESEAAWADMIVILLVTPAAKEFVLVSCWWATRRMVTAWFWMLAASCLGSFGMANKLREWEVLNESQEVSGRTKFYLVLFGTLLLTFGETWRRFGFDLWTSQKLMEIPGARGRTRNEEADAVSLSSSSSKLRAERDDLRRELGQMKQGHAGAGKVPAGAPPVPPPPLMTSMTSLAQGVQDDGPLFVGLAQVAPERAPDPTWLQSSIATPITSDTFEPGYLVELTNISNDRSLNKQLGVVAELIGSAKYNVELVKGGTVRYLHGSHLRHALLHHKAPQATIDKIDSLIGKIIDTNMAGMSGDVGSGSSTDQQVYAPLAQSELRKNKIQAKTIKDLLSQWSTKAATQPAWPRFFWKEVHGLEPLSALMKAILVGQGYVGPTTLSTPRVQELREKLAFQLMAPVSDLLWMSWVSVAPAVPQTVKTLTTPISGTTDCP